jgi:hypothetical protein
MIEAWHEVPCDEWPGARTGRSGYGEICAKGKIRYAHRAAWEEANGPIPPGMFVLHRCDNPPCREPRHLFIGTQRDNMRDMVAKGRHRGGPPRKEACSNGHPLTGDNVIRMGKQNKIRCRTCRENRAVKVAKGPTRRKPAPVQECFQCGRKAVRGFSTHPGVPALGIPPYVRCNGRSSCLRRCLDACPSDVRKAYREMGLR